MNIPNYEEEYEKLLKKLPLWLRAEMPTFVPHYTLVSGSDAHLASKDTGYTLLTPEGLVYRTYQASGEELQLDLEDIEDNGFFVHHLRPENDLTFLSYETEDGHYAVITPFSQLDALELLGDAMNESLQAARDYRKDPADFYRAFKFLDTHMSMWTNRRLNSDRYPTSRIIGWVTESIFDLEMPLSIYKDIPKGDGCVRPIPTELMHDMGVVTFMLEGGPHIGNESERESEVYADCYIDPRLVSFAPSFEGVVIEYAKKLDALYDEWGNERE